MNRVADISKLAVENEARHPRPRRVINYDSDKYIKHADEWRPSGSLDAIARLTQDGWRVVVRPTVGVAAVCSTWRP